MNDKNIKIRYCASVLSIPKKIIECGPLFVHNYKIKCDSNFEPYWYKIHIKDDVEKLRKIEKEILMSKYSMEDFAYNTSDEIYYKQNYDDEIYLFHHESITNYDILNDNMIKYNEIQNVDNLLDDKNTLNCSSYLEYSDEPFFYSNKKKWNLNSNVILSKSTKNKQKKNIGNIENIDIQKKNNIPQNIPNTDENVPAHFHRCKPGNDDSYANHHFQPNTDGNIHKYYYDDNESDVDSYDYWSPLNISDTENEEKTDKKTDEKKVEDPEMLYDFDDYIY